MSTDRRRDRWQDDPEDEGAPGWAGHALLDYAEDLSFVNLLGCEKVGFEVAGKLCDRWISDQRGDDSHSDMVIELAAGARILSRGHPRATPGTRHDSWFQFRRWPYPLCQSTYGLAIVLREWVETGHDDKLEAGLLSDERWPILQRMASALALNPLVRGGDWRPLRQALASLGLPATPGTARWALWKLDSRLRDPRWSKPRPNQPRDDEPPTDDPYPTCGVEVISFGLRTREGPGTPYTLHRMEHATPWTRKGQLREAARIAQKHTEWWSRVHIDEKKNPLVTPYTSRRGRPQSEEGERAEARARGELTEDEFLQERLKIKNAERRDLGQGPLAGPELSNEIDRLKNLVGYYRKKFQG